jgi:hypothetical protein
MIILERRFESFRDHEKYGYEAYIDSLSGSSLIQPVNKKDSIMPESSIIVNINQKLDFTIYPNPTSDFVIVKFNENFVGAYKFCLNDMYGKTIFCDITNRSFSLDLNGYRKGIYSLTISGNDFNKTRKIILK